MSVSPLVAETCQVGVGDRGHRVVTGLREHATDLESGGFPGLEALDTIGVSHHERRPITVLVEPDLDLCDRRIRVVCP